MTAPLRRLPLGGAAWTVRPTPGSPVPEEVAAAFAGGALGATVPGCVHDDLLAHGAIPDPYLADNEARLGWVGRSGWRYARPVPAPLPAAERVDLVAEGLDTVARVELGGALVGTTANMHRTYRWDVTDLVRPGAELAVTFSSPYEEAERVAALVGPMPGPYDEPYPYLRKMASNFGWDWGPTVVTAGIWKDVRLEAWSVARLASVRPVVSLGAPDAATGHVRVLVRVERSASGRGATLDVSATAAGRSAWDACCLARTPWSWSCRSPTSSAGGLTASAPSGSTRCAWSSRRTARCSTGGSTASASGTWSWTPRRTRVGTAGRSRCASAGRPSSRRGSTGSRPTSWCPGWNRRTTVHGSWTPATRERTACGCGAEASTRRTPSTTRATSWA